MASVIVVGQVPCVLRATAQMRGLTLLAPGGPGTAHAAALLVAGEPLLCPSHLPTLKLVAGGDHAVIRALDAGADDAVSIAADPALIAARLAALVRRSVPAHRLDVGELTIDTHERRARRAARELPLLSREYALLLYLARRAGDAVSAAELREAVLGLRFDPGTNVLAVHVSRLRAKLDRGFASAMLLTDKRRGYRLVAT